MQVMELHHWMQKSLGPKAGFWVLLVIAPQHADCTNQLTSCDFLLVFYSDVRSRWNRCPVISRRSQQVFIAQQKEEEEAGQCLRASMSSFR